MAQKTAKGTNFGMCQQQMAIAQLVCILLEHVPLQPIWRILAAHLQALAP
jgi:hypothetical protein